MRILITGPTHSGRTRLAQAMAETLSPRRTLLTTAEGALVAPTDASWGAIAVPLALPAALHREGVVVVDCLSRWVANLLRQPEPDLTGAFDALLGSLSTAHSPVIVVTSEVGWGPDPVSELARRHRDAAGELGQRVAEVVDRVVLVVAGQALTLKGPPTWG